MAKKSLDVALVLLRLSLGGLFLYAGLSKVMNPEWTAAGFLGNAETFPALYDWFASAGNIGWVNFLNQWGQVAIGLGLITGTLTRFAAWAGALLMVLYYFPVLNFPFVGEHGFLVDEHLIYAIALGLIATQEAGMVVGLDKWLSKKFKWKWL